MNILFLDPYPDVSYRISKDQNGAYGTANNYGNNFFSKLLNLFVKSSIDCPQLFTVQSIGELKAIGHKVKYSRKVEEGLKYNYDLIVLPSSIVCHETEVETVKVLKKNDNTVLVVGPFATSNPKNYINAGAKVIYGEPEMFFHKFNYSIEEINSLPNLIKIEKNIELDDLSEPGWDIIFDNFIPKHKFLGNGPAIYILSSRGCPYSCFHYCTYPLSQGRKLRLRNPKKLVEQMFEFQKKLGVNNFIFRDPVFSINRNHTVEICQNILKNKYKFNICIETHLKNIDQDLAIMLKKAGVKLIYCGIETSDEKVKKDSKRASDGNTNEILKIKFLEKLGIKVKAMYIIGMPSDTEETYKATLNFSKKINSTYAQFSVFTPYPGTPIFKEYENIITKRKLESFTQWDLVFKNPNFTEKKVKELLSYSYLSYYLRLNWIIKYISQLFK